MPRRYSEQRSPLPRAGVTVLLTLGAAALAILPLALGLGMDGEEPFAGADTRGTEAVQELSPGYEPWIDPVFEAPSGEVESGLFALQAAIGAGIIGYYFGVARTRAALRERRPREAEHLPAPESEHGEDRTP